MAVVGKVPSTSHGRRKRRRLRSLPIAPTLLTLGNLLCGFAAIHFALRAMYDFGAGVDTTQVLTGAGWERVLPSFLSVGAGLVLLGMVFDGLDGLVARATRSTTNFGGQLDSLSDVVTCGVAPATLMVAFVTTELAGDSIVPSPLSEHALGRFTWIAAAIYVAFTAIRLARFNVEHAKADYDPRMFRGLPSPGAAAIVVAFVIVREQFGDAGRQMIAYAIPIVALIAAFLMVSGIPYRRFYRAYLIGRRPFGQLVGILLLFVIFWSYKAPTLVVLVVWYGLSGPIEDLYRRCFGHRTKKPDNRPAKDADGERQSA